MAASLVPVDPIPPWAKVVVGVFAVAAAAAIGLVVLGDSEPGPVVPAGWRIAPSALLDASTTVVPIVVHERSCASGRTAEGRIVADIAYGTDTIDVDIGVAERVGDVDCQGNPYTPYELVLAEPLGARRIEGERWDPALDESG